ncbi:hypothetical protein CC80DRAFT_76793 [Byssothecium circinans]|uniref:Uncharacterized protein n=1 Tax=Byssothecium circinans TaxID=147558 RepID=A0A6A5U5P2_9PLEO|nr:hypothetical protein CC80DRAFT_76793 [Byssothecium circinans]
MHHVDSITTGACTLCSLVLFTSRFGLLACPSSWAVAASLLRNTTRHRRRHGKVRTWEGAMPWPMSQPPQHHRFSIASPSLHPHFTLISSTRPWLNDALSRYIIDSFTEVSRSTLRRHVGFARTWCDNDTFSSSPSSSFLALFSPSVLHDVILPSFRIASTAP